MPLSLKSGPMAVGEGPPTPGKADKLLDDLEAAVKKVDASQASRVRLQRAELELLGQIQKCRDFTDAAGKSKDLLQAIFGGDCLRIARIRAVCESVKFSPAYEDDARVSSCLRACDSVERVLQDLGLGSMLSEVRKTSRESLCRVRESIGTYMVKPSEAAAAISKALDQDQATEGHKPRFYKPGEDPVPAILAEDNPERLLQLEPSRNGSMLPWMIWMVHRAHLDDPTLKVLDFTNLQMPAGDSEARIAPKLCNAIAANTHIKELNLSNTNLKSKEARLLAASLGKNRALRVVNVDSNCLSPDDLNSLAQGVGENRGLQEFRCNNQHGQDAGRAGNEVLETLLDAVRANTSILKLGMNIADPHYNNEISNQLTRNQDLIRQKRARRDDSTSNAEAEHSSSPSKPVSPTSPMSPTSPTTPRSSKSPKSSFSPKSPEQPRHSYSSGQAARDAWLLRTTPDATPEKAEDRSTDLMEHHEHRSSAGLAAESSGDQQHTAGEADEERGVVPECSAPRLLPFNLCYPPPNQMPFELYGEAYCAALAGSVGVEREGSAGEVIAKQDMECSVCEAAAKQECPADETVAEQDVEQECSASQAHSLERAKVRTEALARHLGQEVEQFEQDRSASGAASLERAKVRAETVARHLPHGIQQERSASEAAAEQEAELDRLACQAAAEQEVAQQRAACEAAVVLEVACERAALDASAEQEVEQARSACKLAAEQEVGDSARRQEDRLALDGEAPAVSAAQAY